MRRLFALTLLFLGCGQPGSETVPSEARAVPAPKERSDAALDDAQEAVFRHLFQHNHSALQSRANAYCLSFARNTEPAEEFLQRFKDHSPPVRKLSEFQDGRDLQFSIDSARWIDDDTVEIEGGYFEHGDSASSNRYQVSRESGQWVVVEDKLLSIS